MKYLLKLLPYISLWLASCGSASGDSAPKADMKVATQAPQQSAGTFAADSAMAFLHAQVDFGPRVPGSKAHEDCGEYLATTLSRLGADTVVEQRVDVTAWNGDRLPLRNILARFNPDSRKSRLLLVAHWDSRPWADAEGVMTPIDGANDGASGVAVLLEIARLVGMSDTDRPVDILLVDGEDYGAPDGEDGSETTWCLGTQQWVKTMPYDFATLPRYAVLLDMVGGKNAKFHREIISDYMAADYVDMIWRRAARLGLGDRFVNSRGGAVVDDHLFLNRAGIPAVDIIESMHSATGSFNPTWHTHDDNIDNIDPATLGAVGRLVEDLVFN